jgi:hypothetical protein
VIQDLGKAGTVNGAILAPNGMVHIEGPGGGRRLYNGTIIADLIHVRGADRQLKWASNFFPLQPDFVELME